MRDNGMWGVVLYFILMGALETRKIIYSKALETEEEEKDSTPVFRNTKSMEKLPENFEPPVTKCYDLFKRSVDNFPKNECFGRQIEAED